MKTWLGLAILVMAWWPQTLIAEDTVQAEEASSLEKATAKIDENFSGVVSVMVDILFWGPLEFTKYDDQGDPILKKDPDGNLIPETNLFGEALISRSGQPVFETEKTSLPLIVLILSLGGIFFTFRFGLITLKGFGHSIQVIRGKYDNPEDEGEITHFQALTSALSATVGLGNIAGVAVAIGMGGPGAVFWMWACAAFGMASKFCSCTLAQIYRQVDPKDGKVNGGPMHYISMGFREMGPVRARWGETLAFIFAMFCIGGALGGGNLFQSNQTYNQLAATWPGLFGSTQAAAMIGVVMAILVGIVIIGGIKRIGTVTSKIVPFMCTLYVLCSLWIVLTNFSAFPGVIKSIFHQAFNAQAAFGGVIGVLIVGVKRAAFSNEAGLGSAAICHAAAKTDEPVREGMVAMIGPFIDTIVICTMTAFAVIISGVYESPEFQGAGIQMTSAAFETAFSWFPVFLSIAVIFFAYSTMISWGYYGERSVEYLFGEKGILPYKIIYLLFTALGPILTLNNVITFSDLMILSMAFPNILAMVFLSGKVKSALDDYWRRFKSGEMKVYR